MGFQQVKQAQRQRQFRKRAPQLASTILRVAETDPDGLTVMVNLPGNAADALGVGTGPWPLEERQNPKHAKTQPNRHDLLGLPGGNSKQSMKVEPGSTIMGDDVKMEDGKVSVSWFVLGSGPKADGEAGGPATVVEGHIHARRRKDPESGETKFSAEVLHPDRAQVAGNDAQLADLVTEALDADGPGDAYAVVRVSGPAGETIHRTIRRGRTDEGPTPTAQVAAIAVEMIGSGSETMEQLRDTETVTEVIPARRIAIGGDVQSHLSTALSQPTGDRMQVGAKKFRVAEIHPKDRGMWPTSRKVEETASERQRNFIDKLAQERGIAIPPEAKSSQAAASAWLDERKLLLGFSAGQLVVREGLEGDDGRTYDIAVGCALSRRSGLPIDAIATPACPKAPEAARSQSENAAAARAELMAGRLPAQDLATQAADEPEAEAAPGADAEADEADEGFDPNF